MSSLALMRWLESAPHRYDAGMRAVTLGRVDALHDCVATAAVEHDGDRVLEIGCGTGAVTARMVDRGARVTALDQNPEMLEQARSRVAGNDVDWMECTAAEIDRFEPGRFDAIVASLSMSEMSAEERTFVLSCARSLLRPDGRLVVADEMRPTGTVGRVLVAALRMPQAAAGWLLAGSLSRPLRDAPGELACAGFEIVERHDWLGGSLAILVARPREASEQGT